MASGTPSKTLAKSIGHYVLMKTIGEGTFGKVKLGTHILTGERVAVKVLEKERIVQIADVERVAREIHILKLIRRCRHIIQLYEIIETPRQLYLIMEYASGGELFDYIVSQGRVKEEEACKFLHQILAGIERVHAIRVVHRDLKPENLLLDERKDIKIVDFGLSNTYQEGQLLQTACGSPCYAAPEMIAGHKYVPSMVDIWSCGVILFALVCGFLPFEDQNHTKLYEKILHAEYEMPDFVSKEVANLITCMLTTDPEKRITLADIRQHVWYKQIPEASLSDGEDSGVLDESVMDQLESYGFPRDYAVKCLQTNKHNHATTTYYLIKEKRRRAPCSVGESAATLAIADLDATEFDGHGDKDQLHAPRNGGVPKLNLGHVGPGAERGAVEGGGAASGSRSPRTVPAVEGAVSPAVVGAPMSARPASAGHAPGWPIASPRTDRPYSRHSAGGGYPAAATPRGVSPRVAPFTARPRYDGYGGGPGVAAKASVPPRRRPFPAGETGPPSRRACSPWAAGSNGGAYGDGLDLGLDGGFEADITSPRARRPSEGVGAPPLSARPRLQGNSGARPRPAWHAGSATRASSSQRQGVPHSARGAADSAGDGGAYQVSYSSSRPPRHIMQEVLRVLAAHGIASRQASNFMVRCQSQGMRFQAEVLQQENGGGWYTLRLSRIAGDLWHYKDICARLLAEMHL